MSEWEGIEWNVNEWEGVEWSGKNIKLLILSSLRCGKFYQH